MKRYLIVLMLLSLAATAVPAGAVELQQGWYANFGYVMLQGTRLDENNNPVFWGSGWTATSATGQTGPLLVQPGNLSYADGRMISVTANASVAFGVLFEDSGSYPASGPYYDTMWVEWGTNYDATRLQLQLLRRRAGQPDELVWAQNRSGLLYGGSNVWDTGPVLPGDGVVFRLVAIPEPSAFLLLACGMTACLSAMRHKLGGRER